METKFSVEQTQRSAGVPTFRVGSGVPASACYARPWSGDVTVVRIAPMSGNALEQSSVRMTLLGTHAAAPRTKTPHTKDGFARSGIRTKEPPV